MQHHLSSKFDRIIKDYLSTIEKVARVEYKRIPPHMVDLEELVSIGAMAIQAIFKDKSDEERQNINKSYIGTAIRWAIRNELRNRYKWYTFKQPKKREEAETETTESSPESSVDPEKFTPGKVREAIYESILSIDGISESQDGDSPFEFIKDQGLMPDEQLEIVELSKAIRDAISKLPHKERTIVEYRFYRNMQVKDIAAQVGLSSSRVTRIVQYSMDLIRQHLKDKDHYD